MSHLIKQTEADIIKKGCGKYSYVELQEMRNDFFSISVFGESYIFLYSVNDFSKNWFTGGDVLELQKCFKSWFKPICTKPQVNADGGADECRHFFNGRNLVVVVVVGVLVVVMVGGGGGFDFLFGIKHREKSV